MLDWRPLFPEKEPRPIQIHLLDELTKHWNDYDVFVVEAPTGTGKSALSVCLGRWLAASKKNPDPQLNHTYITTCTVELQEQSYERPYSRLGLSKLYSADRFKCHKGGGLACGDGARIGGHQCDPLKTCPYRLAKGQLIRSPVGVLNLAYYLHETTYGGELPRRGLLVCDEAHAVPESVMSFVALKITDEAANDLSLDMPADLSIRGVLEWLRTHYEPQLTKLDMALKNDRDKALKTSQRPTTEAVALCRKCTGVDKHLCAVRRTLDSAQEDWVVDIEKTSFTLTPLSARAFVHEALIQKNDKTLFMTATVLDEEAFKHELGLDDKKVLFISLGSPFKPENRAVHYIPSCKLKHNDLTHTVCALTKGVKIILDHHPDDRGIIFVSSYAQTHELIRQVNDPRLITHVNAADKKRLMRAHNERHNSVIVSPSMHVGVDLKDDLSRFQIVAKLPFPSLGLTSVKTRSELEPRWYAYRTALTLVQATGRSVRSETDKATTYILDTDFGWFFSKWKHLFPSWWLEALKLP
jgi:ATP-dependent DNA helicase DinG